MSTDAARTLARLGEFFAVEHAPDDRTDHEATGDDAWHPLVELVEGPFLNRRVVATHVALSQLAGGADVEERVAASIASLGLFARLLSPTLGARLLGIDAPADVRWREQATGTLPLAAGTWTAPDLAAVVDDVVVPIAIRLHDEHGVPEQVLSGNASSAVFGSLKMVTLARPDLREEAHDLGVEALAHPYLEGTGDPGPPYVRRSCCLYYRIPRGGYCGDCVLAHR